MPEKPVATLPNPDFAPPLKAMIAPDAEVRVITAIISQLELDELGLIKSIHEYERLWFGSTPEDLFI